MAIKQTYNLDIVPKGVPEIVHCSQYDKQSRIIEFNILKGGESYSIPSESSVTVRGTKKDYTGFEYTCSYSGDKVSVVIEEQMTIFAGDVACELRIMQGSTQILGTANFILRVEPTPLGDDTVISETQLPLLEEAIEAASTVADTVERVSSIVPSGTGTDGQILTKSGAGAVWSDVNVPTKTSELTNDSGFITKSVNDLTNYTTTTDMNTALDNKVSKTGDSMTGELSINSNIKFSAKAKGLYTLDGTNFEYPMIRDNGSNLWIGAEKTAGQHHRGATLISSGYNGTKGNESIEIVVPNSTNTGGTGYKVWHEGNYERYYSNPSVNSTISVTDIMCVGWITGGQKDLVAYIPYPVLSGSATIQALSLNARMAQGGYPFIRSGTSGGTYTQLGSSKVSLVANGSAVRTNEISSFSAYVRPNCGIQIVVSALYQYTSNNTGTIVTNNQVISLQLIATIKLT